jgi:hypothetical protein
MLLTILLLSILTLFIKFQNSLLHSSWSGTVQIMRILPLAVTPINRGWADAQALCSACQFIYGHWIPNPYVNPRGMMALVTKGLLILTYVSAFIACYHIPILSSSLNKYCWSLIIKTHIIYLHTWSWLGCARSTPFPNGSILLL